jgi:DNA-binding NtrC family response regulator
MKAHETNPFIAPVRHKPLFMNQLRRSILLVDDEESIHCVLGIVLRDAGYLVADADNGEIGFQMFLAGFFDAVITDWGMPRMTGEQPGQAIKKVSPNTPVILVTGHLPSDNRSKLFDEVLQKPFAMTALLDALERVLADPDQDGGTPLAPVS